MTSDTMVSTRTVPWMKLGELVDQPMTAEEAAEQGGLNFSVSAKNIYFEDDEGERHEIKDRRAIVRDDDNTWLGIASKNYPILQYGEAFNFMDTVSPTYVAAGTLHGGRQGFMVAKAPNYAMKVLGGKDPHDLFLVLRTSHDCTRAVEASVMPLRGRCMNQLTLRTFSADAPMRWTVKHTTTMHDKLKEAQSSLTRLERYGKSYGQLADKLAHMKITEERATETLKIVLPDRPKRDDQIESIVSSWHTHDTVGFDWTGWGLVNAVSEYFEWTRPGGSPQSRFIGALQGQTHRAINRTASYLLTT